MHETPTAAHIAIEILFVAAMVAAFIWQRIDNKKYNLDSEIDFDIEAEKKELKKY